MLSRGRAEIDISAIESNVIEISAAIGDSSLCAVVKADGYGHGSVEAAKAAQRGGAAMVAVATVTEAQVLRSAEIGGQILLLSEAHPSDAQLVVDCGLTPMLYSASGIVSYADAVAKVIAEDAPGREADAPTSFDPRNVHLKIDTGMNRVGASPGDVGELAELAIEHGLVIDGICTHLACADDPHSAETERQLDQFERALKVLAAAGIEPRVRHVANSAGALVHPDARYDLVRCGISIYGLAPSPSVADAIHTKIKLQPALSLISRVSFIKDVGPDVGISYGHRFRTKVDSRVVTVPLGYGDGIPRALGTAGGEVLIKGQRHPIVGNVTMDQFMVLDTTPDRSIKIDDEVVLIGAQGDLEVTADEWANALGTINYEIVTRLGARLERTYKPVASDTATG